MLPRGAKSLTALSPFLLFNEQGEKVISAGGNRQLLAVFFHQKLSDPELTRYGQGWQVAQVSRGTSAHRERPSGVFGKFRLVEARKAVFGLDENKAEPDGIPSELFRGLPDLMGFLQNLFNDTGYPILK